MKLLLRRDQRAGMLGKPVFTLAVRADLSAQEKEHIQKYKLGDVILYETGEEAKSDGTFGGGIAAWNHNAKLMTVCVRDLAEGKQLECKSIVDMLAHEEGLKTAAERFATIMRAAASFGGEEVVEV